MAVATIARRGFLIASVAIAGGVAFGTWSVRRPADNPLAKGLEPGQATFNAWVRIGPDGIVLITPHVDLGQGTTALQSTLIAEEMDLDPGQFTTDPGRPDGAYWNTALAADAVPFRYTDDSIPAEALRDMARSAFKLIGAQVTGGSSTASDSFDKLRHAGAVARETLKAAASQKTGTDVADLRTESGAVVLKDGTRIAYTDLAGIAAGIDPVKVTKLRDPSEWRLIGHDVPRLDIPAKSTGTLTYGIDLTMEGMVHATCRVNPRKGAGMRGFDASRAEGMPGVLHIVTLENGVAVVATNTWYAMQAMKAVRIDWDAAPYPAEQADHWAEVAASFTEERLDSVWRDDGDIPAALNGGAVIETEYRAPYVAHQPLEPLSALVRVTADRADLWVGHQMPRFVQQRVAKSTGLPESSVHFHNQYVGGSFGHRLEFENIDRAVEVATALKGVPVKLTFTREEDFAQDFPRQIAMARARGVVKDGKVHALDLGIAAASPSRSQAARLGQSIPGPDNQIVAGAWDVPYRLPHHRVAAYAVPGLSPVSSWRSVGASHAGFFADCALDELIHAAGADALEERLRLIADPVARKVLEAVGEMSDWGAPLGAGQGRGIAFVASFGVPVAEVVEVTMTDRGIRLDRVFVAADVGRVIDPLNFENLVQGGVIWGLGHAINSEITYSDGAAQQTNYHMAEGLRLYQTPEIIVRGLENGTSVRGIGEPPVPPAAPALANAIFAATGQRIREMPFNRHIAFI